MTVSLSPSSSIKHNAPLIIACVVVAILFAIMSSLIIFVIYLEPKHPDGWYPIDIVTKYKNETMYLDYGYAHSKGNGYVFLNHTKPERKIQISAPQISGSIAISFDSDQYAFSLGDGWLSVSKFDIIYDTEDQFQPSLFRFVPVSNAVGEFTMTTFNHIKLGLCDYNVGSLPNVICGHDYYNLIAKPLIFSFVPRFQ